ncbi:MAG: hypothetical protein ACKVT0_16255 [Planctomycetaceae bacterium]
MKLLYRSFPSLGAAIIAAGLLVNGLGGADEVPSKPTSADHNPVTYKLLKDDHGGGGTSSFRLHITVNRPGQVVTATCELRKDKRGVGRFPLRSIAPAKGGQPLRFDVLCLSDDYIADSQFVVSMPQEDGGTSFIYVPLSEATNEVRP